MRTFVYAIAAYACCAEAFAPMPAMGLKRATGATSLRMAVAEDPSDVMARVNAMMSGLPVSAPRASFQQTYTAPAAAAVYQEDAASIVARVNSQSGSAPTPKPTPTWRWSGKDAGGYNPRGRSSFAPAHAYSAPASAAAPPAEDPAAVMARVMAMMK